MLVVLCAAGGALAAAGNELLPRVCVVKAQCLSADAGAERMEGTCKFRVVHVYTGEQLQVGDTFAARFARVDYGGSLVCPPPSVGEEGFWALARLKDRWVPIPALDGSLPSRAGLSDRYVFVQKLAGRIEIESLAATDERPALFEADAYSDTPEIARWGIQQLSVAAPDSVQRLAQSSAAGRSMSLAGQTTADAMLSRLRDKAWTRGDTRVKVLRQWVREKLVGYDSTLVGERLLVLAQHPDLSPDALLSVLKDGASNRDSGIEFRRTMLRSIGFLAQTKSMEGEAFNALLALASKDEDGLGDWAIGTVIVCHVPLNAERISRIESLRLMASPSVRRAIDELLRRRSDPGKTGAFQGTQ